MNMVVAVRRHAVPHRNPAAWCARPFLDVELHRLDEVVRDRLPLLVGELAFVGAQRQ